MTTGRSNKVKTRHQSQAHSSRLGCKLTRRTISRYQRQYTLANVLIKNRGHRAALPIATTPTPISHVLLCFSHRLGYCCFWSFSDQVLVRVVRCCQERKQNRCQPFIGRKSSAKSIRIQYYDYSSANFHGRRIVSSRQNLRDF